MITRISKIAQLPKPIRDELNHRLDNGKQGPDLLPWLNALSETKELMAQKFEGRHITHQNLSEWRRGGYQDWLQHQHRLEWYDRFSENETELAEHDRCGDTFEAMSRLFMAGIGQSLAALENVKNPQEHALGLQNLIREFTRLQNAYNYSRRVQLDFDKYNGQLEPEPESLAAPCCPPGPCSRLTASTSPEPSIQPLTPPIEENHHTANCTNDTDELMKPAVTQTHGATLCEADDSRQRPGVRRPSGALPCAPQTLVVQSAENCTEPTISIPLATIEVQEEPEELKAQPGLPTEDSGLKTEDCESKTTPRNVQHPVGLPEHPSAFQSIPAPAPTIPTYKPATYYPRIRRSRFAGLEG